MNSNDPEGKKTCKYDLCDGSGKWSGGDDDGVCACSLPVPDDEPDNQG